MLETSKDLLNIMLGSSVLIVALLFSWLLYQTARTIKGANDAIKLVQNLVNNIDDCVKTLKSKAGNAAAFGAIIVKGAQSILANINKKKASRKSNTKKQK